MAKAINRDVESRFFLIPNTVRDRKYVFLPSRYTIVIYIPLQNPENLAPMNSPRPLIQFHSYEQTHRGEIACFHTASLPQPGHSPLGLFNGARRVYCSLRKHECLSTQSISLHRCPQKNSTSEKIRQALFLPRHDGGGLGRPGDHPACHTLTTSRPVADFEESTIALRMHVRKIGGQGVEDGKS